MRKTTKLMALALVLVMCVCLFGTTAFAAVNITVNRDNSTYEDGGTRESGNRTYTYYQIFHATETANHSSTGGGYNSDGTPGTVTTDPEDGITYYLDATQDSDRIAQLQVEENIWFTLTKSADNSRYTVTWKDGVASNTDTVQAAARWLGNSANYTPIASGNLTAASDGKSWTASDLPEGYYLLKGETGQNLIAATADITVNEKNSYPTVDKKQKDTTDGEYKDDAVNVKVGDTIYYQVEVKVPADAKGDIIVTDTMSAGLTYTTSTNPEVKVDGTALTEDETETKHDYVVGAKTAQSWIITIHPTTANKGKTVVITFTANVNNDTLTTIKRDNKVEIDYGNYHQEDSVEYDIGAAAIIKYDGATASVNATSKELKKADSAAAIKYLEATFTLTDGSTPVNVTKVSDGVYKVDTEATTNTVTSDKAHNGVILIYGLDPDKTYTLTETATEDGYNLMDGTASLSVTKLDNSGANAIKVTVAEASGVFAGVENADAVNTFELNADAVSKIVNNTGSTLPSTGGIGTYIFYIAGAILVLGAGIILVAKKRSATAE